MASSDIQARTTTEAQLIDRAMKDPAFRTELIADPKAVVARELGLDVPDSIDLQVLQETPATVYLVLPPALAAQGSELSDAELATVAGGWSDSCAAECPDSNTCASPGAPCG